MSPLHVLNSIRSTSHFPSVVKNYLKAGSDTRTRCTITFPTDLLDELDRIAEAISMSRSGLIESLCEYALADMEVSFARSNPDFRHPDLDGPMDVEYEPDDDEMDEPDFGPDPKSIDEFNGSFYS